MPTEAYHELFGRQAQSYARYRPGYPNQLFDLLASLAHSHGQAWDCGTGNGQAAVALSMRFDKVIATDINAAQIEKAEQKPNIDYRIMPAESTDIEGASVDLVTSANAVHWFDIPAFFKETKRVLKPGGVVAVWCYSSVRAEGAVQEVLSSFTNTLKKYWPAPIELVYAKYRTLEFPFEEIIVPEMTMSVEWTLDRLLGYVSTWSAIQRYKDDVGGDPMSRLADELRPLFDDPAKLCRVTFPLPMRVGRET